MSDDGTGKLQGPRVQPKDKARPPASQPKASRPPAGQGSEPPDPSESPPSPRAAGRAGLEQNSGFSAAAAEAAAEQQSALEESNRGSLVWWARKEYGFGIPCWYAKAIR